MSSPAGGAPSVQAKVINRASPAQPGVRQRPGGNLEITIREMVRGVIAVDARTRGPISNFMMAQLRGFGGR